MSPDGNSTLLSSGGSLFSQAQAGSNADSTNQCLQSGTHARSQPHQRNQVQIDQLESLGRPIKPFFSRLATRFFAPSTEPDSHQHKFTTAAVLKFMLETFPTWMYQYCLLQLPTFYCSSVDQIIKEAEKTLPEIRKMALESASQGLNFDVQMAFEPSRAPPACKRLRIIWEYFIDSLRREWNTLNIILAMLTTLQIQSAQAQAEDPLIRYTALLSLMCALITLVFGCTYAAHFGSMREPWKAVEWALEAKRTRTHLWWNVLIMLAMPVIWLNCLSYSLSLASCPWYGDQERKSDSGLLVTRIAITLVLGIGVIYGFLIISTFRGYSRVIMEEAWIQRIERWIEERNQEL